MVARTATLLLALVLLLVSSGCQRVEQARQCQAVARTVNPALDEIEHLVQRDPSAAPSFSVRPRSSARVPPKHDIRARSRRSDSPRHPTTRHDTPQGDPAVAAANAAKYRAAAKRYLELAKALSQVEITHKELSREVAQYIKLIQRIAAATHRLADAHAARQPYRAEASVRELAKLDERHKNVSQQINRVCLEP